jgi:gliding motility-associated protein GldM
MLLGIVAADTAGAGKFLKNTIISSLSTEPRQGKHDDSPKPWPETLTKGMPLVATYALLTKLQADLRNVETDVYAYLIGDAEKLDIKISELEALVAAPGAVMPGSRFFGRVFIGAKDTTMTPTIFVTYSEPYYDSTLVNGKWEFKRVAGKNYHSLKLDETGAGVIDTTFGASGGFGGVAVYESNLGPIIKPFKHMYSVGSSSGAITPTKMMVLYAGLPNPIKFAASGGADSRPTLSASGGLRVVSTGGNTATITPPASMIGQTVTLSVSAIGADGSVSRGTSESFVIKPLPSPRISLGGSMGGRKSIDALLSGTLEAKPDATFVFQGVQYTVKSFSLSYTVSGQYMTRTVYGTSINSDPAVAQIIRGLGRGTAVSIESVDVVAPDGQRSIPGPSFTIL